MSVKESRHQGVQRTDSRSTRETRSWINEPSRRF